MHFHFRSLAFVILSVFYLLESCCKPEDMDGDGVIDPKDKCPTTAAKTKDGCPVERKINAIHFYLETSASMGGYFKQDAEFPIIVSDLTAKIDKNIKPISIAFIAEHKEPFKGNPQQFSSQIANTKINPQKSSQLHNIIGNITMDMDSNDIVILVSDCILSFTEAEVKSNPEINRNMAPSTLKSYIYSTFADLNKKKGIGASIYAFKSKFYGTYYDYQNKKHSLSGEQRPFYVWVIGNKELLTRFNAQLATISSFKPEKELHFGLSDKPVSEYRIISGIGHKGDWMENSEKNGIEEIGDPRKTATQFCVALNLKSLPPYAQDVAYLKEHLNIDAQGCIVTATALEKKDADISKLRSEPQKAAFDGCTHVLMVQVTDMTLKTATLNIRLPLRYDTWYTYWSCMDDRSPTGCSGKTFALEHLITGVREAYETRNEDYINITINLEK